jgi:excisionase family DNA binding protein
MKTESRNDGRPRCATVGIREAALILGIGRNQAYAAARSGDLPVLRIGGRILVSRAVLEKMLEGPLVPPASNLG